MIESNRLSLVISKPMSLYDKSERIIIPVMTVIQEDGLIGLEMEVLIAKDHLLHIASLIGPEEGKRLKIKLVDF